MTEFAIPLALEQVNAACRLHQRLEQWLLSDAALTRLRNTLPDFDADACLLKTVAINALYSTQVFAVVRMSQHICMILQKTDVDTASFELVEKLAILPTNRDTSPRKFVSFAAKFCHFFIDEDRFPIYDEAARNVLKLHLTPKNHLDDKARPYISFSNNFALLRDSVGLGGRGRDLDRYLWITGMYMKWLKERNKLKPQMNAELLGLFRNPGREAAAELNTLLPATLGRKFNT